MISMLTLNIADKIHDPEAIHVPEYSQPLTTALQISLYELLKSFGFEPAAVVGHSSGEIAAA
jgi:acyl transferase domain-containing protein